MQQHLLACFKKFFKGSGQPTTLFLKFLSLSVKRLVVTYFTSLVSSVILLLMLIELCMLLSNMELKLIFLLKEDGIFEANDCFDRQYCEILTVKASYLNYFCRLCS